MPSEDENMEETQKHDRRFHGGAERLRSPERVERLELPRVLDICTEGISIGEILDVGTGTGLFAEAFAEAGARVTGIDANAEMLSIAKSFVPGATFLESVAERLPFADSSFDLVFLGLILHETDDPLAALAEARRVSRGRVAVLEWPYRADTMGPPLGHRIVARKITALAEEAGFASAEAIELSHSVLFRLTV